MYRRSQSFACFILITLIGCISRTGPDEVGDFAIYLLEDPQLTAAQVWSLPVENLELAGSPFLAAEDLTSYQWRTHEFTLTATAEARLAQFPPIQGPTGGIPFVVMAGTDRVYLGAFWYSYSSLIAQVPTIEVPHNLHRINKCESILVLEDTRNDERIHRALQEAGILIE